MISSTPRRTALVVLLLALWLWVGAAVAFADDLTELKVAPVPQGAADASAPAGSTAVGPSCRYGVAASTLAGEAHYPWVSSLSAGWYLNFGMFGSSSSVPAEFTPVIRIKQNKDGCTYLPGYMLSAPLTSDGLGAIVRSRPGALWMVGNEPDRGPSPGECKGGQDDTQPEVYAQAYHDVYMFIKRTDPTARVANAGLVQVTPGRLQYLDKVWNAYQQKYGQPWPVDVWNMHLYILPEVDSQGKPNGIASVAVGTDPALGIRQSDTDPNRCPDPQVYCYAEHDDMGEFAKQVVAMRTWMKQHGQQDKPLILSEFSILYAYEYPSPPYEPGTYFYDEYGKTFNPERVRDFMNNSINYLESAADLTLGYPRDQNRLVQRWLWFSIRATTVGTASNLVDDDLATLLLPGQNFQARASAAARTLNLYPARTGAAVPPAPNGSASRSATLTATIRNMGSTATTGKVTVRFYADEARTQPIAETEFTDTLTGCEINTIQVSVNWPNRAPGKHDYWVVVDPNNAWAETDEGDNVIKGTVFVGTEWTFLPLLQR